MSKKKTKINRKYKDTLFRLLFGKNREELLNLYNAVNGSHYTDPAGLTINTLEDAIFVGVKNDVSFVFQNDLNLYEHQSTLCPNLPLRDLFYVADLLREITENVNLYSRSIKKIPTPRFVMFYIGEEDPGEIAEYRLSDMFEKQEDHPKLELIVRIVNINDGQNNVVMKNCRTLREYSKFVDMVRQNAKKMPQGKAVEKAVKDCIRKNILRDFLRKHKARVIKMNMLYEYDEKQHRKWEREEAREEGREEGRKEGREEERVNTERERQRADAAEEELARYKARFGTL